MPATTPKSRKAAASSKAATTTPVTATKRTTRSSTAASGYTMADVAKHDKAGMGRDVLFSRGRKLRRPHPASLHTAFGTYFAWIIIRSTRRNEATRQLTTYGGCHATAFSVEHPLLLKTVSVGKGVGIGGGGGGGGGRER